MDHGLSFLPDSDEGNGVTAPEYFTMVLELSRIADEAGLSHVKMTEHYLKAYGGYCPNPLTFLAAVASITTQIRLMTGCLLPVFHHPIQLASETAMVDAISGGRLDVGFARAYLPYEFDAFGIDMDSSRERFDLTVDTVQRMWARERVSLDSPFFSFEDVATLPHPVQQPGPPIWVAAVMSEQSFIRAGERGFGLLVTPSISPLTETAQLITTYREHFRPQTDSAIPQVYASLPIYVGADQNEAEATGHRLLNHYLDIWAKSAASWSTRTSRDYRGYTGMVHAIRSMTPERMWTVGGAIVGDVNQAVDRIGLIARTLGVDGFLWQVDFGGATRTTAQPSVERLIQSVIPQL